MSYVLHGTFVSEKINKIRWRPEEFNNCHYFVTGSIDNEQNSIKLWDFHENQDEDDIYPDLVASNPYDGDVTEIKFLNADYFVTSSSNGSADLFQITRTVTKNIDVHREITWKGIHYFKNGEVSSCTALAVYDSDIVTVGEDGCINLLSIQSSKVVSRKENADSCSINCVLFSKHNEALTSNLRGQMKIWDLRSNCDEPSNTFMLSGDQVTPTCLNFHPTQRHLILAGDDLGSLTIWDLRQNMFPVNVLNAHEGAVSEIQFHPDHPDQLFSCSTAGDIWHWTTKNKNSVTGFVNENEMSVWATPENVKSKLEVFTLMPTLGKPINTLDLNRDRVICGCDNEAVYLISGINFY